MVKSKRIIIITSLTVLFLMIFIGIGYAFFSAIVEDDNGSSVIVRTGTLRLNYDENEVIGTVSMPGNSLIKHFSVENTGDVATNYLVYFSEVINTFNKKDDLVYTLSCKQVLSGTDIESGTCDGKEETIAPSEEELMITSSEVGVGLTHEYTLTVTFIETGINQDEDQNKLFTTRITIDEMIKAVSLKGYVYDDTSSPIEEAVVILHSDPVSTTTDIHGYYEFPNVKTGKHTVIIEKDDTIIQEHDLYIKIADQNIIDEEVINITNDNKDLAINIIKEPDTLKYEIPNAPVLTIDKSSTTDNVQSIDLKIDVLPLGLGEETDYQYYLSKSDTSLTNGSWINYKNGETFNVSNSLGGTYYLFVKQIGNYLEQYTSINNVTIDGEIYHRFGPYTLYGTFTDMILSTSGGKDAIVAKGNPSFGSSATTDMGLYAIADQSGTSYYFRGAVTNNYVKFAGLTWRIVRINGDGSIRLILNYGAGYSQYNWTGTCSFNEETYMGNATAAYAAAICFAYSGGANVSTNVNIWYNNNIKGDNLKFITAGKYCNDYTYTDTVFGSYGRLVWGRSPNITCSRNSGYNYGGIDSLTLSVGLLSADEVSLAGYVHGVANSVGYLTAGSHTWTMSGSFWDPNNYASYLALFNGNALTYLNVSNGANFRPVINIISTVKATGTGTSTDPYVLYLP